jgi:hypothetical protein
MIQEITWIYFKHKLNKLYSLLLKVSMGQFLCMVKLVQERLSLC